LIAVDTSSLRRFLAGATGGDVDAVAESLEHRQTILPPVVLTEIVSEPRLQPHTIEVLGAIPVIELLDGYWLRAGQLRARLLSAGFKSRVADALIAQSCIDHDFPLITHDRDFRHYQRHGLVLV
jgi:predicted nucleic acid-binding protein